MLLNCFLSCGAEFLEIIVIFLYLTDFTKVGNNVNGVYFFTLFLFILQLNFYWNFAFWYRSVKILTFLFVFNGAWFLHVKKKNATPYNINCFFITQEISHRATLLFQYFLLLLNHFFFFFYKVWVKVVERWVWSLSYDSPTLLFDEIWPFDVVQKNTEVIVQFKGALVSRNVKNWELYIT